MSYLKWMPASSDPSAFCGLYSRSTLANCSATLFGGGDASLTGTARMHAGDDDVVHLDDQELLLALAGLAHRDGRFLDVLPGRACPQQFRRGLVEVMREGEVVERRLACATSAAPGDRPALRHAPGPGEHFDLVLVLVVERFTLDAADFREDVCCHNVLLSCERCQSGEATNPNSRPDTSQLSRRTFSRRESGG